MSGFMSREDLVSQMRTPLSLIPKCGACGFSTKCHSPKMKVYGEGKKGILVISDYPGEEEDRRGRPFVGMSGAKLRVILAKLGVNLDRDCWSTNALICKPTSKNLDKRVAYCRPNVLNALKKLRPKVTLLLGTLAIRSVMESVWKDDGGKKGGVGRWAGWKVPCGRLGTHLCPSYNPAFLLHAKEREKEIVELLFTRHLDAAVQLLEEERPEPVSLKSQVRRVYDAGEVSRILAGMAAGNRDVAFDYETDRLKPDAPDSRIVCCSASDGKVTIAYPWLKETKEATGVLLRSGVGKIASNLKFEERWTRRHFGFGVRNWKWDTMQTAHVLDSRRGICSIKFQAWALLGQEDYDSHIHQYLKSRRRGGNEKNRIDEVRMDDLLLYCGLDSLLEWKVARIQMKEVSRGNVD